MSLTSASGWTHGVGLINRGDFQGWRLTPRQEQNALDHASSE